MEVYKYDIWVDENKVEFDTDYNEWLKTRGSDQSSLNNYYTNYETPIYFNPLFF